MVQYLLLNLIKGDIVGKPEKEIKVVDAKDLKKKK